MSLKFMSSRDVTKRQFQRQLLALDCNEFELGVKHFDAQTMVTRRSHQSIDQLLRSTPWLKHMNAKGHHIYVRPERGEAVVLVDDLCVASLLQMDQDGIRCACVVETSDLNFQAWVRVSKFSIESSTATCLGELLAVEYGGDLGSKDFRHFGRAVGFTNVKPEHRMNNGLFPFTKIVEASGGITPNCSTLIDKANQLEKEKARALLELHNRLKVKRTDANSEDVEARFEDAVTYIHKQYGPATDPSRADAYAAMHLLFQGFCREDIERAMLSSVDIRARHPKTEDYVSRTLDWACLRGHMKSST